MKNITLYTVLLLLTAFSCDKDGQQTKSICENSCEEEVVMKELSNVTAKVITVCPTRDENGDYINCIYAISIDEGWLDNSSWPEPSDNILVPCNNIPSEFRKVNLRVSISGLKKSCCNLLTKPEFRASFGCKFEITSIEKIEPVQE